MCVCVNIRSSTVITTNDSTGSFMIPELMYWLSTYHLFFSAVIGTCLFSSYESNVRNKMQNDYCFSTGVPNWEWNPMIQNCFHGIGMKYPQHQYSGWISKSALCVNYLLSDRNHSIRWMEDTAWSGTSNSSSQSNRLINKRSFHFIYAYTAFSCLIEFYCLVVCTTLGKTRRFTLILHG